MTTALTLLAVQDFRTTRHLTISDIVLVAAALVAAFVPAKPLAQWCPREVLVGVALMAAGGLAALARAPDPADAAALLARLLGVAALSFFVVGRWMPDEGQARRALQGFVVVAAASAALGVLAATTTTDALGRFQNGVGRAEGLAGNANLFGAVSAVAVAVAAVLALGSSRRQALGWVTAVVVLVAGIAWSGSRSALLAAAVGLAPSVVAALRRRGRAVVLAGLCALVVLGGLAAARVVRVPVVDRSLLRSDTAASERAQESTEVRLHQLEAGLEARGGLNLLLGGGLRDDNPTALHSGQLEVWVGLGALGLIGWIVVMAATTAPALRLLVARDDRLGIVRSAVSSGFLAYAVCALFVDNVWNRYIWLLVAMAAVHHSAARWSANGADLRPPRRTSRG